MGCQLSLAKDIWGVFLGDKKDRPAFLEKKVEKWLEKIDAVSNVSASYPREAFSAFCQSLQAEWNFSTRTLPDVEEALDFVDAKKTGKFRTFQLVDHHPQMRENYSAYLPAKVAGA